MFVAAGEAIEVNVNVDVGLPPLFFLGSTTTTTKTKTVQKNGDINKQTSKVSLLQGKFGGGRKGKIRCTESCSPTRMERSCFSLCFLIYFFLRLFIYLFFTRLFVVVVADIDTFILTGNGLVM